MGSEVGGAAAGTLRFFLNGHRVEMDHPSVDTLLIDYLREPDVGLSGPKKPCGQGGCGGCTVIVSEWDVAQDAPRHRAVNACLKPLVSLQDRVVTTIEGTGAARRPNPRNLKFTPVFSRTAAPPQEVPASLGSAQAANAAKSREVLETAGRAQRTQAKSAETSGLRVSLRDEVPDFPSEFSQSGVNPVAWRLAINNGTQCGYCTTGFVMNMSEFISNNPRATKREIEAALDGNLCRCTGYRPIVTGFQTLASDWTEQDEANRMKCLADPETEAQKPTGELVIPFPDQACRAPSGVDVSDGERRWLSPQTLDDLVSLMQAHPGARLVAGNTAFGIYKSEIEDSVVRLSIAQVPELHGAPIIDHELLDVAAGTTYSDLLALTAQVMANQGEMEPGPDGVDIPVATTALGAVYYMAERTAGRIVRNGATLGGNTMLVLHHILSGQPFPSDLLTALVAIGASVELLEVPASGPAIRSVETLESLVERCLDTAGLAERLVLLRYRIPTGLPGSVILPQKVALRDVNAHSIINHCCRLKLSAAGEVTEAVLVFGGVAPYPWRASQTEAALVGQQPTLAGMDRLAKALADEVRNELDCWKDRMASLPSEGFTDGYRVMLTLSALYKDIVHACIVTGEAVPSVDRSAAKVTWGRWPASGGTQSYKIQDWKAPVSQPYVKIRAVDQASGQVRYTHELPVPPLTINASFVQSTQALADWHFTVPGIGEPVSPEELRLHLRDRFPAFIDLITAQNVPTAGINLQGMGGDQPVFSTGRCEYAGQALALVAAASEADAHAIAGYVTGQCIGYSVPEETPGAGAKCILTIDDAIERGSIYPDWPQQMSFMSHIWRVTRPGSDFAWAAYQRPPLDRTRSAVAGVVDNAPCVVVSGTQTVGGQAHFYMEPQAVLVEPGEGRRFTVRPSSQSPMEMHQSTVMALGVQFNSIDVRVPPVGGGFGGKTEQARFVTAAAAIASYATKRPVRLTLSREQDMAMIGKRHAYYGQYQVAIDTGESRPEDKGLIRGLLNRMWGDGGAFYDCSFIVANCIQARADNAYRITNFENQVDVCKTNTAPSTAFRAFGDVQSKIILESAIDDAAFAIGMRAEAVREKNLYYRGDVTPFGQALSDCYIRDVWSFLKKACAFDDKVKDAEQFNAANRWRKRGVALIPVKYGSGYNLAMLEQGGAMISVYQGDGTIVIHQGGVEMGQGLLTQMRQIAAYVLNVPMDMIEVKAALTSVIPNPSSTGGSTGTAYNGEAVKRLCAKLRERLAGFATDMLTEHGPDWCVTQGIDFWNHPTEGWQAKVKVNGRDALIWQNIVALAYQNRQSLMEALTVPIAGGETQSPALTYKPFDEQPDLPGYTATQGQPGEFDNFVGFTYSAGCSVVEVDILTGETKILSSDLAYDMGWSLNPAIDIGQVEGAFVQGIGYVLSEKLVLEEQGAQAGRLNSNNTWTYKPPAVTSIPLTLNTHLFPRDLANVPCSATDGVLSSKEVGEPPLVLATTVFLAVKDAVRTSRVERGLSGFFQLDAPATVQEISRACQVDAEHFQ